MDIIRIGALLILATIAGPAAAQTVYRCKAGDGFAYQDRPCTAQTDAGTHSIRATPGGAVPPAVKELVQAAESRAEREREIAAQPPWPAPRSAATPAVQPRKGYRCRVQNGMRTIDYYQYEPCTALMPAGTHFGSFHRSSGSEYRITDYAVPIMRKTEQKEMSARQACEGMRSQIDPYERYKRPNPCKDM